jgi:hypothetical protein
MPPAGLPRRSDTAAKAVQQRQGFSGGHRIYVASLAQDGQIDEARTALDRLRELQPEISVAWIEQNAPLDGGANAQIRRRHAQGGIGPLSWDEARVLLAAPRR